MGVIRPALRREVASGRGAGEGEEEWGRGLRGRGI